MRYTLFILVTIMASGCFSSFNKIPEKRYIKTGVVQVELPKEDIFNALEMWFAKNQDPFSKYYLVSREGSQIFGKSILYIPLKYDAKWEYLLELQIKDNKVKYTISEIMNTEYAGKAIPTEYYEAKESSYYGAHWDKMKTQLDTHFNAYDLYIKSALEDYKASWQF